MCSLLQKVNFPSSSSRFLLSLRKLIRAKFKLLQKQSLYELFPSTPCTYLWLSRWSLISVRFSPDLIWLQPSCKRWQEFRVIIDRNCENPSYHRKETLHNIELCQGSETNPKNLNWRSVFKARSSDLKFPPASLLVCHQIAWISLRSVVITDLTVSPRFVAIFYTPSHK